MKVIFKSTRYTSIKNLSPGDVFIYEDQPCIVFIYADEPCYLNLVTNRATSYLAGDNVVLIPPEDVRLEIDTTFVKRGK